MNTPARATLTLSLWAATALAQPNPPAPKPAPAPAPPAQEQPVEVPPPKNEDRVAATRLGGRASLFRSEFGVIPIVVVVPDARSFVEAVAHWTPDDRFPVLIDDGSAQALEDIARFVRGFHPDSVVRWSFKPPTGEAWPKDPAARRVLVEQSLARSYVAPVDSSQTGLVKLWKKMGVIPPGIVVGNIDDPAWPAALTLAIAHAQPLTWITVRQDVNGVLTPKEGEDLATAVERAAEMTGLTWKVLGDDVDAISLCLNCPAKIALVPGQPLPIGPAALARADNACATTDRVGRPTGAGPTARWAWASQVFGSERQSAYRAMCAVFLEIKSAWLFDGYPAAGKPWTEWDCTKASNVLRELGFTTLLDDSPHQSRADWRNRAAKPLDAGMVLINSKGECLFFELEPGQAKPGDIPLLNRPTIVHMVHSWSLQYPNGRGTVGGRWIDAGAYAYFGSIEEPFLSAFLPTPVVAARFGAGFAWAAACRNESLPLWRLACIGDPLITPGPTLKILHGTPAPLPGSVDVREQLKQTMAAAKTAGGVVDFAAAIRLLVMLGDDAKAATLVTLLAKDQPTAFTPDVAAAAIFSLARAGNAPMLAEAYARLDAAAAKNPYLRDALWIGAIGALGKTDDKTLLLQLRKNLREDQIIRDAQDLSTPYQRVFGKPAALEMLNEARTLLKDAKQQAELDKTINGLR